MTKRSIKTFAAFDLIAGRVACGAPQPQKPLIHDKKGRAVVSSKTGADAFLSGT